MANSANMKVGDRLPLVAKVLDSGGFTVAGDTVVWSTSDATVATVQGLTQSPQPGFSRSIVMAIKVGTATVTATSTLDDTKSLDFTVTVVDNTAPDSVVITLG